MVPDEVVHILDENKIDCGVLLLYQEDWYQMAKEWKREHGNISKNVTIGQYDLSAWYCYFLSYRNKEDKWMSQFDKFAAIWKGNHSIREDERIGNKKITDWAIAQIQDKDLTFWKEDMLDEIGFIWNEHKMVCALKRRMTSNEDTADTRRLQKYIDKSDPAGITFIDVCGFVPEKKGDLPWSGNGFFRCEVGINSVFNEKQFIDYVKKCRKKSEREQRKNFSNLQHVPRFLLLKMILGYTGWLQAKEAI